MGENGKMWSLDERLILSVHPESLKRNATLFVSHTNTAYMERYT